VNWPQRVMRPTFALTGLGNSLYRLHKKSTAGAEPAAPLGDVRYGVLAVLSSRAMSPLNPDEAVKNDNGVRYQLLMLPSLMSSHVEEQHSRSILIQQDELLL
jgi:hypothetical protein